MLAEKIADVATSLVKNAGKIADKMETGFSPEKPEDKNSVNMFLLAFLAEVAAFEIEMIEKLMALATEAERLQYHSDMNAIVMKAVPRV